jgi:hypothetical protein
MGVAITRIAAWNLNCSHKAGLFRLGVLKPMEFAFVPRNAAGPREEVVMGKGASAGFWIAGVGVGAGCMYLMDPDCGRARRALLQDKATSVYREVRTSVEKAQADLANRAHGLLAEAKSALQHEPVEEDQLIARVRAKLGRLVSHPHAIDVFAHGGAITLSGAVLEHEAQQLVSGVGAIHGVSLVCDHLVRHHDADYIATLRGGRERHPTGPQSFRHHWPPALRMLAGVAGAGVGLYGLFSSSRAVRAVALPFGMGLLARGISTGKHKETAQ